MTDGKNTESNGETVEVLPMERPEFYHERVSYQMGADFGRLNREIAKHNLLLDTTVSKKATPEERLQVSVAKSEAYDTLNELQPQLQAFLARIIKSVPRSWLVEGAPATIKDGEWLKWMQYHRSGDLGTAYQEAGTRRREDRKN